MPAFSNRALTFDDLLQLQGGEGQLQAGGVGINKEAEGSYQLDPRYAAQLRAALTAPPAVQSPREQMVHGGKFFAGAAPFGFAGPGSLNFDPSADSATRGLNAFRAPAPGQPLTFSDISGTVRSYANALPIVGGLNNKIEAGLEAAIAPALNPFFDPQDQLSESSLRERYNHALEKQNDVDAKFAAKHPDLDRAAKVAARLTLLGAALRMSSAPGVSPAEMTVRSAGAGAGVGGVDAAIRGKDVGDGARQGAVFGSIPPVLKSLPSLLWGLRSYPK